MPAAIDISELRASLRKKFPAAHRNEISQKAAEPATTYQSTIHFDPGTINEVVSSSPSQGVSLLISYLLEQSDELPLVLIDGRDSFDPASHGNELCCRLFWIRCISTDQMIKTADLLIRDGNLPLILLDLHLVALRELSRIPSSLWQRFRNEARDSGCALAVLSPRATVSSAHTRYFLEGAFTLDHLEKSVPSLHIRPDLGSRMSNRRISS